MNLLIVLLFAFGVTNLAVDFQALSNHSSLQANSSTQDRVHQLASECPDGIPGQFSVCAGEVVGGGGGSSGGSGEVPMRECRYFANGTIDVPTMTVITAWVPVGSRPCIGDEVAEPSSSSGSTMTAEEIELRDRFTALAERPTAWWSPGSEVEFEDEIELHVQASTEVISGVLLGRSAQIRFRPVTSRWELSNGRDLFGFHRSYAFSSPGNYWAKALVSYEVDYKYSSANWVYKAASWELASNKLSIAVVERERRTLLVG
jgi:hypothetical protein